MADRAWQGEGARGNGAVPPQRRATPARARSYRTRSVRPRGPAEAPWGERRQARRHAHPALSEILKEAALAVDKRAIHG